MKDERELTVERGGGERAARKFEGGGEEAAEQERTERMNWISVYFKAAVQRLGQ